MDCFTHDRLKPKKWRGHSKHPFLYLTAKYDGRRLTLFKQKDGRLLAFGRDVREHLEMSSKVESYEWYQKAMKIPPLSSLDGELWVPGNARSDVVTAINERRPELMFTCFAVPTWGGRCVDSLKNHDLSYVRDHCTDLDIQCGEYVQIFKSIDDCQQHGEAWTEEAILQRLTTENAQRLLNDQPQIEGYVLKAANYQGWWKVKPEETVDAVITGIKEGKGQFYGLVGALKVSVYKDGKLVEIACVSGMDEETREEMTELHEDDELVDRVVEVSFQLVGAKGRLIHPRFKRWRDDKPKTECLWEQIEDMIEPESEKE